MKHSAPFVLRAALAASTVLVLAAAGTTPHRTTRPPQDERPNVLFLISDDLGGAETLAAMRDRLRANLAAIT